MPKTEGQKSSWARAVARNRTFINEINARTVCAHCGARSIEWHNPEHVDLDRKNYRIGMMVATGKAIASIEAELSRCTPLCRRCHMAEDGRLRRFVQAAGNRLPAGTSLPPTPCVECERLSKPLRLGLCFGCYRRQRRLQKKATTLTHVQEAV